MTIEDIRNKYEGDHRVMTISLDYEGDIEEFENWWDFPFLELKDEEATARIAGNTLKVIVR